MNRIFKVRQVVGDTVEIMPFIQSDCSTCHGSCSDCHAVTLTALNPKKLELKPGMVVKTNVSTPFQSFCNISALLVPVLCAVLGFFCSVPISSLLKTQNTESFKAFCVLIFLLIPAGIIFAFTRKKTSIVSLQVVSVMD